MLKTFDFNGEQFKYYTPEDIRLILKNISRETRKKHKIEYYNTANAFDIETTSIIRDDEKIGIMWMWSFALEDNVIIGRTWQEFIECLTAISKSLVCYSKRHFVIYCHNLPFEFQWLRRWFEWDKVFCLDKRKPILAITTTGIEFRCSLALSGYALANLPNVKHKKLVGELDYSLTRHNKSDIKINELAYSIRDVQCVVDYIQNKIIEDRGITKIPMTKTGYVRLACRNACYGSTHRTPHYKVYRELMEHLTIVPEEYDMLKYAFQGGFTHANPYLARKCSRGIDGHYYLCNVGSFDISSDYPTEMVAENGFPMSKGEFVTISTVEELRELSKDYFLIIDITIFNLEDKIFIDNPLSKSRCIAHSKDIRVNNGRVTSAGFVQTIITSIDFEIFEACYTMERVKINRCIRYLKGYLPTPFVTQVLEFYKAKTTLKGVTNDEVENADIKYMWGKENLNATFGCSVTDPCQDIITYTGDIIEPYYPEVMNVEKTLSKYNKNKNRFLFYPWGVAITALARRRLWGLILACGNDYCYADTDSVKVRNPEKYEKYFKKSDEIITRKLQRAVKYHGLKWEDVAPKNKYGESKQLGLWELEHVYKRFRANGAKRYMYQLEDGSVNLTVSGLNKKKAIPYISARAENDIEKMFKMFDVGMEIPPPYSGRMISYYIDDEISGTVTDYNGVVAPYYEKSAICLTGGSYTMDYMNEYEQYKHWIELMFNVCSENVIVERRLNIE